MTLLNDEKRFTQATGCLCPTLKRAVLPLAPKVCSSAQEIRLRLNRPLSIVCTGVTYYVTANGGLSSAYIDNSMLNVTRSDIADTFHNLCNYSVYSKQNEIINGFVTMRGGHRAGICGTAVFECGKITNIRDISSINIRIAREHKGCAEMLLGKISDISKGLLLCGTPCSGKTTVLRDIARIISSEQSKNVSLIDERGELAAVCSGAFQNDIGMCDVFDGYKKSEAMRQAVRVMAPDFIVCDELGCADDIAALEQAQNCGVALISSVHASDKSELIKKPNLKKLLETRAFETIAFLSGRDCPGQISRIYRAGEIIGS